MTPRPVAVVREAFDSAVSQPVASAVTILVVTAMVLTVMLTTGRAVGAEQQVLNSIDDIGTRAIEIRADDDAGLTSGVLERLENIEGIEWSAAFSSAMDATNTLITDGTRVPVRQAYGEHLDTLGIPSIPPLPDGLAYASPTALHQLGLPEISGSISTTAGDTFAVAGSISTPDFLKSFEPLVLAPVLSPSGDENVNVLVVIAARPDLVTPVSDAVLSVLSVTDPTKVSIQTSEAFAQLRTIIQSQLGTFSRGLLLIILAVTGALVGVILYALVMMRRKDFGRRRALGATRGLIITLLLVQTVILAVVGVALGLAASSIALVAVNDPLPGVAFAGALAALTVATAAVASLVPAIVASTREPLRELRVP